MGNMVKRVIIIAVFGLTLGVFVLSCGLERRNNALRVNPYFITGTRENQETLRNLFSLLAVETPGREEHFIVVREIINQYVKQNEYRKLINFLTSWVNRNPDDPYNTYYLYMIALAYIQEESFPVAAMYLDMIIKNYPDLIVMGESIHLTALNHLISFVNNPQRQVWYYEELIDRFSNQIDLGAAYFLLGQAYEQVGEWNNAIRAYTQYLPFLDSNVPGFPNAHIYARQLVDFHNSPKNWTFESLDALVAAIRSALSAGSPARLEQTRAKVNFFARTWEQDPGDDRGMVDFHLSDFMRVSRIHFAADLDPSSNANEAFLRTWGWSQHISTWYLYFRKINFPADPEIHGRWEWAGVFYGEKF
jgi:tetratricopeptide (TPR) repeat protein